MRWAICRIDAGYYHTDNPEAAYADYPILMIALLRVEAENPETYHHLSPSQLPRGSVLQWPPPYCYIPDAIPGWGDNYPDGIR